MNNYKKTRFATTYNTGHYASLHRTLYYKLTKLEKIYINSMVRKWGDNNFQFVH